MDHKNFDRRQVIRTLVIGGVAAAVIMPTKWTKPLISSITPPAHAAASAPATTVAPVPSDVRLKRDIVALGTLTGGLTLYRFRYVSSDEVHVGVMAQEVLSVAPEAVIMGPDGFLRVNYDRLGIRMMTWAEWQAATFAKAA